MTRTNLAVFIDLDDTLTDRRAAFATWALDFLRCHDLPEDLLPQLVEFDNEGRRPRDEFLAGVPALVGVQIDVSAELVRYRSATANPPAARGVTVGLAKLKAVGAELFVLSNGVSTVQRAKLESSGLIGWFDRVLVSDEVGISKPNPEIFTYARNLISAGSDCWMVGDHTANDILAAKAAGFSTAWVSHDRSDTEAAAHADVVAATTQQCLELIAGRYTDGRDAGVGDI